MKWVIFAAALAAVIPFSQWLRKNPRYITKVWVLFGLLPFALNQQITFIDWAGWPGYVKGLQVTAIDLLALAIFINLPRTRSPIPFRFIFGLYFVAVVVSIFNASVWMAAVFYAWQLIRIFFIYFVVMRASTDERVPRAILTGMAIGLCYQALLTVWQRFGLGILQAGGTYGDQNLLGLVSEFGIFPLFALLLAGERGWQVIAAPIAGITIAVMTTSRAAVGLGVIGLALVFMISSMRGWTARKASVLFAGVIAVIVLLPLALHSFEQRFAANPISTGYDERAVFKDAAAMILSDHPFGIGVNNYVVVGNTGGYFTRANVPWGGDQRNALVHNAFWLAAAESGYFGAIALMLVVFCTLWVPLRCGWQNKGDIRGDLLLGLGVSLLIVAIHDNYEWVFYLYPVQYLFAMTVGMATGLAIQLGYWGRNSDRTSPENISTGRAANVNAPLSSFQRRDRV